MPDARCTRDLMRNVHKKCAHEHTGEAENIRHSLRNGFTAYNALSPVSHVLLPPSTPTMGRQDHASLPYALAARVSRSLWRPPQPAPRRDDGRRPYWVGRDGKRYILFYISVKANYFRFPQIFRLTSISVNRN